ncbi:MAG: DUF4956 domain-containing protein [Chloroflexi bacterium]|nr:DUF4956 domain-containing protein [Chloroflexota bacterium]
MVLLLSFALGHVIAWVYVWTHTGLSYSQSFTASLVILPVIVSLIMLLMVNNIVTAFGLLAVFAVVRFRNVLKDTRDTTFILWAIVQGMAVGTMLFSTAVTGAVCVGLVYLYLRLSSFGARHRFDVVLSLNVLDGEENLRLLKQILKRHSGRVQMASQRHLDDRHDLSYRLLLRNPALSRELVSELEGTQVIDQVSLYHREDESEM